jgi:ferric-dicitrate binding protein FerR (iron transport regulator)
MTRPQRESSINMMPAADIEAAAADWLIRLDGDDSLSTRARFEAWLAADARHRAAFLRLENVWNHADRLRKLRPLSGEVDVNVLERFGLTSNVAKTAWRRRMWRTTV